VVRLEKGDEFLHLRVVGAELVSMLGNRRERVVPRVSFTLSNKKFNTMKLMCWISSAPASTNSCADMKAGTWPLTRRPRACAASAMMGTNSGLTDE
jgi:hypothetical protein